MRLMGVTLLLALAMLTPAATAAQLVVVEARGVALKQGDVLDDARSIKLEDGQLLTLVAENGSILTLRGPYDQAPAAGSSGVDVALALDALVAGKSRNVSGVMRVAATDVHLPDPWLVDLSHPGIACLHGGQTTVFWRASDTGSVLTMTPSDHSWRGQTQWPAGSATMEVPATFPIKDGRIYLADFGGKPVAVTLTRLPSTLSNPRMQAARMLEKGCVAQAEALLKTVR